MPPSASKPNGAPEAQSRRPQGPRLTTIELIDRIVTLQLRQAPLDIFGNEALTAALDTFGASAGALLLYHCEDETLALVAERGLSDAGRQQLIALRRGAANAWEIPLHGLLNRKAYIIERPDQHPFVPELVARDEGPRVVNLATVPLYRGALPVGVLLLIADRRPIAEPEIISHVLALDVLALALEPFLRARRQRVATPEAPTAAPAAPEALVCEPWVAPGEAVGRLEAELSKVTRERQTTAARLADVETRLAEAQRELESERAAAARLGVEREQRSEDRSAADRTATEAVLDGLRATLAARDATLAERDRVLAARDAALAERERSLAALTAERDHVREDASRGAGVERALRDEVAAKMADIEHLRATHAQALARATAEVGDTRAVAAQLASAQAELMRLRGEWAEMLAVIDDPTANPAQAVRALRDQVTESSRQLATILAEREALAGVTTERDELEGRLQLAFAEREEAAAAASAREHRALECLQAERHAATAEREALLARLAGIERVRDEHAAQAVALERQVVARGESFAAAVQRGEALERELATLHAELARLREDRTRMLAVVDDPDAEPAAVLQALRENVAALEAQVASFVVERTEQERRATAGAEEAEHRLAIERRKLAEARAAYRLELEGLEAAHRAEVERLDAARRTQVGELESSQRRALERSEMAHQRTLEDMRASVAQLEEEQRADSERLEAECEAAQATIDALRAELATRETSAAPDARVATQPAAASEQVGATESRVRELERELARRNETQIVAESRIEELEHELARTRSDSGRLRADHERALANVEAAHQRALAETETAHKRMMAVAAIRTAVVSEVPTLDGQPEESALDGTPAPMEVRQVAGHRILEPDATRRAAIFDVLAASLPPAPGKTFMVVNLLTALPDGAADLAAAATAGVTVIGYAADTDGQSHIIGALRCFEQPPTADEVVAALGSLPAGGPRRVLTLSDDIDAFLSAKAGLTKAGHSLSMACDAKQAIDLLTMLRPDAVLVDLRTGTHAAVQLLATLAREMRHTLVLLVHGDSKGHALPHVMRRLLRPAPLEPMELVQVCRAVLDAAPAPPVRGASLKPLAFDRPKPSARKPAQRRLIPRRR